MLHLSIAIFNFIVCTISSFGLSSMAIHWATDPMMIIRHNFPFEVAFGLTIPTTIASFILFVLLLFDSTNRLYLVAWVALIVFYAVTSISITSPQSLDSWINRWDIQWSNTSFPMSFQLERRCCGWESYEDRSIENCPFLYYNGCKELVRNWILDRYNQIFETEVLMFVMYMYSVIVIIWTIYHDKKKCIWVEIEIPFLGSDLYDSL